MTEPLVSFRDVTVVRNGRTALSGVNLTIGSDECVAILGPNGCGKSTLVKVIAGDLRARTGMGEVRIRGLKRWNLFELRSVLGIVSNDLQAEVSPKATGLEVVLSGYFGSYGYLEQEAVTAEMREAAFEALERVEATHLANQLYGELSSGEGRRVLVARALVHSPLALLLDEPTSSLDMRASFEFRRTVSRLAEDGVAVILVTHHLEDIVPEVRRVVLLKRGTVFADGPRESVLTSDAVSRLFEMPMRVTGQVRLKAEVLEAQAK